MVRIPSLVLLMLAFISGVCAQAPKPGQLTVTVLDSLTKQPVGKALITVQNKNFGKVPQHGESDDSGTWSTAALDAGEYYLDVHAIAKGYRNDEANVVSIKAGQSLTRTILLTPDGIIEGTITDQDGVPLTDIRVEALLNANVDGTRTFKAELIVFTDDHGQYRMNTVPPGNYVVKVTQPSFNSKPRAQGGFAATYYPAGNSRQQAVRVNVLPATTTKQIDFRLRSIPTFRIQGRVSGLTSGVSEVFTVQSCAPSVLDEPDLPDRVSLERDGSFHIQGLVPGIYCVSLLFRSVEGNISRRLQGAQIVNVEHDLDDVRITLLPAVDISGIVKSSSSGSFLKPERILLEPTSRSFVETNEVSIDPKTGNFLFSNKPQQDYKIHMYPLDGYQVKSTKYGSREIVGGEFRPTNQSNLLVIEIAPANGQLSGRVNYGARMPEKGIYVAALREGVHNFESGPFHADVDEQGGYRFDGLPPGSYRVSAFEGSTSKTMLELFDLPDFLRLFPSIRVKVSDDQESTIDVRLISSDEIARAKATF